MAKKPASPLKITAKLLDGRIYSRDGIIMLDGILYHAWFLKYHPEVFETGKWMNHGSGYVGLPVRKLENNRWAASKAVYEETSVNIEYWNKRPDFFAADKIGYLDANKGLISDRVGDKRAYRTPCIIRTIKDGILEFYCVGRKEPVEELLNLIPNLGKKACMGWGNVSKWTVEEIEEDYSLFHPVYGLMRPTPVEDMEIKGYPIMEYAIKPPYHKRENRRLCYVPIQGERNIPAI